MNTLTRVSLKLTSLAILGSVALASYNSMIVNNDSFMNANTGIKFTKRLDEINGKVTVGRMAASSSPWQKVAKQAPIAKEEVKVIKKNEIKLTNNTETNSATPAPAIAGDLELKLSNVFYQKPLEQGSFSGSAKTVDGIIEEIYVSFPNGQAIEINTRERMVGNVFQYEDPASGEMKSGMFYEVKAGTYMITLTNDSQFPGARLEFTGENSAVAYSEEYQTSQESWEMDNQNYNNEVAQEPVAPAQASELEYAQNNEATDNVSYGFNFQS
jgi:hypothetical protein